MLRNFLIAMVLVAVCCTKNVTDVQQYYGSEHLYMIDLKNSSLDSVQTLSGIPGAPGWRGWDYYLTLNIGLPFDSTWDVAVVKNFSSYQNADQNPTIRMGVVATYTDLKLKAEAYIAVAPGVDSLTAFNAYKNEYVPKAWATVRAEKPVPEPN